MDIFSELQNIAEEMTLTESHFKVGQKVKCKASGMTGEVIKVDPEEKGKYYTVRQDSGKVMKYAPDELTAVMKEAKEYFLTGLDYKGTKHTYKRRGPKMTDPIVVYIDGKEWKTFKSMPAAKKAALDYIKGGMKEEVELDEAGYKVPKNYAAMMAKKRKKAGTSEFDAHPDKKKDGIRKQLDDLRKGKGKIDYLKRVEEVELDEIYDTGGAEEVGMAVRQLHFIKYAAEEIMEYVKMRGDLDEWFQNKLANAHMKIQGLHSYIEGDKRAMGMDEELSEGVMDSMKKVVTVAKAFVPMTRALNFANKGDLQYAKNNIEIAVKITAKNSDKSESEIRKDFYNLIGDKTTNKPFAKLLKTMGNTSMKEEVEVFTEASQALINKIRELAGGPDKVPSGAAFRELKKKAQDALKKEKAAKKAEPEKKEVSKTSTGKTRTGSADPSDKNIIMQLRKAQDVDGNMDIRVSPERTTRLNKKQIDTLLKQHDSLSKPRDKRMFTAKLTRALRKK